MPGACTTCTATCGSGARTGTANYTNSPVDDPRGHVLAPTACSGAVAGRLCVALPVGVPRGSDGRTATRPGLPRGRSSVEEERATEGRQVSGGRTPTMMLHPGHRSILAPSRWTRWATEKPVGRSTSILAQQAPRILRPGHRKKRFGLFLVRSSLDQTAISCGCSSAELNRPMASRRPCRTRGMEAASVSTST